MQITFLQSPRVTKSRNPDLQYSHHLPVVLRISLTAQTFARADPGKPTPVSPVHPAPVEAMLALALALVFGLGFAFALVFVFEVSRAAASPRRSLLESASPQAWEYRREESARSAQTKIPFELQESQTKSAPVKNDSLADANALLPNQRRFLKSISRNPDNKTAPTRKVPRGNHHDSAAHVGQRQAAVEPSKDRLSAAYRP